MKIDYILNFKDQKYTFFLLYTIARHVRIILGAQTLTHPLSQLSYVIDWD